MSDWIIIILGGLWFLWVALAMYRVLFTDKYPFWPLDDNDL